MKIFKNGISNLNSVKSELVNQSKTITDKIKKDIKIIEDALKTMDIEHMKEIHLNIDGNYQACIKDWGQGMLAYRANKGFLYGSINNYEIEHNLKIMKAKLEAYLLGLNYIEVHNKENNSDVNVVINNNNSINIEMSFEQVYQKIENMPGLTQTETEEIQRKIKELEEIYNENISKKKKWEEVKPIISFVIDKGADVAIMVMGLILQMGLGM